MSGGSSDYTTTPYLGLYKPIFNRSVGTWGDLWNSNADAIDSAIHFASGGGPFLPLAGGTVVGPTVFNSSGTATLLAVTANPTFAGPWAQSFYTDTTGRGSASNTGQPMWNLFNTVDSVHATAADSVTNVANYFTCSATLGSRIAQQIAFVISNTNDAPGNQNFHQALSCQITGDGTLGGTSATYGGSLFGANILCVATGNAKYIGGVAGLEVDVAMRAGSSAAYKGGLSVVLQGTDAVESTYPSTAFGIGLNVDSPASKGWARGIQFGGPGGWWPMNTTSGIMLFVDPNHYAGGPAYACASGIDFSAVTFSGNFLKSAGFAVDGLGHTSPLLANATNDAAAATAGVPIGALYRNGNAVQVRVT